MKDSWKCLSSWEYNGSLHHQGSNWCHLISTIRGSSLNVVMDALLTTKHIKYIQMQEKTQGIKRVVLKEKFSIIHSTNALGYHWVANYKRETLGHNLL